MWLLWGLSTAWAGGYFYSDAGIVATGRGGAFVAGADNQFAQYYNPAGLIRVTDPTVNIGLSGVQQNVSFTRQRPADPNQPDADPGFYDEVQNEASPFLVPQAGIAGPLIRDRLAFAVGFYSPFAPSADYDPDGPQRYSIKNTLIYQFAVGPSFALRVHDTLTLGLGLQWQYLQVGESLDIVATGFPASEDAGDIAVDAQVVDLFTPSANVGLLFEPVEQVAIGLSVQPPSRFQARGTGTLDFEGSSIGSLILTETLYTDDDVALNLDLPLVLRGGVAVRPVPRLEIEAAVVYQRWSGLADLLVEDIDITVEVDEAFEAQVPPEDREVDESIALPAGFRDTVSLRLGAEAEVVEGVLDVRAGGFWENGAVRDQDLSVALVDPSKVQIGAGASLHLLDGRLNLDGAAAFLFFPSLEIRDSTVTQIDSGVSNPLNPNPGAPLVVGNGNLRSNGWVLGLQASWAFKRKKALGADG